MKTNVPPIAIVMGSDSDWPTLKPAADICADFGVACDVRVLSAHRTPLDMMRFARQAHRRGVRVIIAGAGGAAHLPGMMAALTPLPVVGVPVESKVVGGLDSLLSIVQMPGGVPVATVSIGGGRNAGLLALRILSLAEPALIQRMSAFQTKLAVDVRGRNRRLQAQIKSAGKV